MMSDPIGSDDDRPQDHPDAVPLDENKEDDISAEELDGNEEEPEDILDIDPFIASLSLFI